jgi:hypothetical protein
LFNANLLSQNQELHHTGEHTTIALKRNQHHKHQPRIFHFAEEEDTEMFQEKLAEDLLLQLLFTLPKMQDLLISTHHLVFSQHALELIQMFQRLTVLTEEHQFAMEREPTELQEKDADLHFHCAHGMPSLVVMEPKVLLELIAKPHHFQPVVQSPVDQPVLTAPSELQEHQSLLLKKKRFKRTRMSTSSQLAPIDLLSTANQFAPRVKPLDALKSELQLHCQ